MPPQTRLAVERPRILHNTVSTEVFAYPSGGGFVRKYINSRIELDWIGLISPTTSNEDAKTIHATSNASEEDRFALRVMQMGGRWWPNEQFYGRHSSSLHHLTYGHHYPPYLDTGYSSTGHTLVLRTWIDNSAYLNGLPGVAPEKPDDWSRLSLCATMEERCAVLREFGAVEYDSVEVCPDVPKTLEQGIAMGREYEQLLKKMEDEGYVDRWMCNL